MHLAKRNISTATGHYFESLDIAHREYLLTFNQKCRYILSNYTESTEGGSVEVEALLAEMIAVRLKELKEHGQYQGTYQVQTHSLGYQGRSAMPSKFDCNLAYSLGMMASICVEYQATGLICSIRGLVAHPNEWIPTTIPFTSMLRIVPTSTENLHPLLRKARTTRGAYYLHTDLPMIPVARVSTESKAYRFLKTALVEKWMMSDCYCNPGPVQYYNSCTDLIARTLHEEQHDYFQMLMKVKDYANIVSNACSFGVDKEFLRSAYLNMQSLILLRYFRDDMNDVIPDIRNMLKQGERKSSRRQSYLNVTTNGIFNLDMMRSVSDEGTGAGGNIVRGSSKSLQEGVGGIIFTKPQDHYNARSHLDVDSSDTDSI